MFLVQLIELHCSTLFLMKTTPQVYPCSGVRNTLLDYQIFDRNDDERRPEFFSSRVINFWLVRACFCLLTEQWWSQHFHDLRIVDLGLYRSNCITLTRIVDTAPAELPWKLMSVWPQSRSTWWSRWAHNLQRGVLQQPSQLLWRGPHMRTSRGGSRRECAPTGGWTGKTETGENDSCCMDEDRPFWKAQTHRRTRGTSSALKPMHTRKMCACANTSCAVFCLHFPVGHKGIAVACERTIVKKNCTRLSNQSSSNMIANLCGSVLLLPVSRCSCRDWHIIATQKSSTQRVCH